MRRQTLGLRHRWDIYEAVVALAWADAKLTLSEVRAARTIASELDLLGPFSLAGKMLRGRHARLPDGPPPSGKETMDKNAAAAIYTSAAWVAQVDGQVHRRESIALGRLRRRLRIDASDAQRLERIARSRGTSPTRPVYRGVLADCLSKSA